MILYSALFNEFHPFDQMYKWTKEVKITRPSEFLDGPGVLVIWGGEDIHPDWYGRENVASHVPIFPSRRDVLEAALFKGAVDRGIPIVGVCRGAQLGCALSGGFLIQDVTGHGIDHMITDKFGDTYMTSSLHHQMMYPWKIEHELIAWSTHARSKHYEGLTSDEEDALNGAGSGDDLAREPEVMWFPNTKCLAIQGHPEYERGDSPLNRHVAQYMDQYVFSIQQ